MASNPMQRKARNSFLLGMVITLLISAAAGAFMFMQIKKLKEQIKADQDATKSVYVLNQDIKSGQVLTTDLFSMKTVKSNSVPADATSNISTLLQNYSLCDKSGNNIYTNSDGSLYMMIDNNKTTVYKEESTGVYYTQNANGNKNYIETTQKELIAKVDLKANTIIASSYITRADEIETDDMRKQEYNTLVLPIDLVTGDYVDVRLLLPTGQDYIVIAKKKVTIPEVGGSMLADTISVNVSEDEILTMSCAIVEAYKMDGAKLYATKYTEAGLQEAATPTYVVNEAVAQLINTDSNILKQAKEGLWSRYNANDGALTKMRNQYINDALSKYGEDEKYIDKMTESVTTTKESRQQYLQSLSGTATQ